MRDRVGIILVLVTILFLSIPTVYAIDTIDVIETLDWSNLESFFNNLPNEIKTLFDGDIKKYVTEFSQNSESLNIENLKIFAFKYLYNALKKHISLFAVILLIVVISSFFKTIKPDFASNSVGRIVDFSVAVIIGGLLSYSILSFITSVSTFLTTITSLIQVIFPLIFTLLSTVGATISTASFQLSATIFANVITTIIVSFILPITVLTLVFSIISTIKSSSSQKISLFLANFAKKMICAIFFIFSGFLALQGVSVSVKDSVGVRLAKFSLSKYVPIIGGYLSDGFNYLFAGSVLLKNSIGISFILLLLVLTLPLIVEVVTFHVLLKISSCVSDAVSENKVTKMLEGLSKCTSLIITSIIGVIVCLVIFACILILSCNSVL